MIIDLNDLSEKSEFLCDICIIGTGAAGLALASEFLNSPHKILLVESGGLQPEAETQLLYQVENSGIPLPGAMEGRFRIHGGSTTQWAGQALPLMESDFEKRDWIPNSGWPISFNDVKPYYARANQFLSVDKMNFDTDLFRYLKVKPPILDASKITYHYSKWSPQPNVRENYLSCIKASQHCHLLLHASVTKINLHAHLKSTDHIIVNSLNAREAKIKSRYFVICAGGIESARLLLTNTHQMPKGIGNDHDVVGRFFQDHPSAYIGWLKSDDAKKTQHLFNLFHKKHVKYSVRCTASFDWQKRNNTLNVSSGITFHEKYPVYQNLKNLYSALRNRDFSMATLRHALPILKHPVATTSSLMQYALHDRSYFPGCTFQIGVTSEQEPNPDSRITLSSERDALGICKANINWKLSELTRYSIQQFALMLRDEFHQSRLGEIALDPWIFDASSDWTACVTDQFHHMGTTRMHDNPRAGVVDKNCKLHDIENLYIASSAVFPTSGHSNPTLTILALCFRLSDQLKNRLKNEKASVYGY